MTVAYKPACSFLRGEAKFNREVREELLRILVDFLSHNPFFLTIPKTGASLNRRTELRSWFQKMKYKALKKV